MRDLESSCRYPSVVNVWIDDWAVRRGPLPIANYPPDARASPDWSLQIRGRTRHSPMLIPQTAPRPGSISSHTTFIFLAPFREELPAWLGALGSLVKCSWKCSWRRPRKLYDGRPINKFLIHNNINRWRIWHKKTTIYRRPGIFILTVILCTFND